MAPRATRTLAIYAVIALPLSTGIYQRTVQDPHQELRPDPANVTEPTKWFTGATPDDDHSAADIGTSWIATEEQWSEERKLGGCSEDDLKQTQFLGKSFWPAVHKCFNTEKANSTGCVFRTMDLSMDCSECIRAYHLFAASKGCYNCIFDLCSDDCKTCGQFRPDEYPGCYGFNDVWQTSCTH